MHQEINIFRSDNRIVIDTTDKNILGPLKARLTYVEKKWFKGKERFLRKRMNLPEVEEIIWECYGMDHKGRLSTSFGFCEKIISTLNTLGYKSNLQWSTEKEEILANKRNTTVYTPNWDRIEELIKNGFEFRHKQRDLLELLIKHEHGRIDCFGGFGKTTTIMLACLLFPKAKIDVVTKRISVLHQRIYPELALNLPSVGLIGGGKKIKHKRVMCISADSLHHCRPDADFVFVDEADEACADRFAENLGRYNHAHMWGFSATWDMRLDNKNMRGEAIFGPIRIRIPYEEGVKKDIVVPIEVYWHDVIMDTNPCADREDTEKDRIGIWTNEYRNKVIKNIARSYDEDTQVLITVNTLEHALNLKKYLPEFELVYASAAQSSSDWEWFNKNNLIPDDFKVMTEERRTKLTSLFTSGKLKKAIATTVWNVGVDFRHLQVLIRADASGSPTRDTQIPCRNARKHKLGDHLKPIGIIHDLKDQFDKGFNAKAKKRKKNYEKNGWKQHEPSDRRRSKLRKKMKWGSKS